mmetsp:Transcript_4923/g.8534  ORF Transcript_4923/g.8534 Transcript_4923/m.8534 type:complete len:233 (-) Transcript_4923:111-809(-)
MDGHEVVPRGAEEQVLGGAVLQAAVVALQLDVHTVVDEATLLPPLDVVSAIHAGEAPLTGHNDLLLAGELELSTTERLAAVGHVLVLATNGKEDLSNAHASADTLGLSEGTTHTGLEPISSSARKHLVDTQHVEGVHADAQMEGLLSGVLGHELVARNTGCLHSLGGHLLLLPGHKMHAGGESLHGVPLHTHIVNADLGIGHSTAVPGFGVRLVLDLAVATSRTATHGDRCV